MAMTLIQSAKLNGIDPMAWLTDVLERVVSGQYGGDLCEPSGANRPRTLRDRCAPGVRGEIERPPDPVILNYPTNLSYSYHPAIHYHQLENVRVD